MMPPKGRKRCRSSPPDLLTNLPDNVIDVILMCLPIRDAVRTSILSKKWRYNWCRLTVLTLDKSLWKTTEDLLNPTVKFKKIIYQLLTLHEGPITKFTLDIGYLKNCTEIDNLIYFLSRNDIQHLVLHLPPRELYRLPSSFFTFSQLRHLTLYDCLIHPPAAFKGFDRLISLRLSGVTISSELLGSLISHCPLLEQLVLKIYEMQMYDEIEINAPMLRSFDFTGRLSTIHLKNVPLLAKVSLIGDGNINEVDFDFAKVFGSCSALEHLLVDLFDSEFAEEAPTRLPFDLNCVRRLSLLGNMLEESRRLSWELCLIRSFQYLEYLEIKVHEEDDGGGVIESLELERFSDVTFNHLREVKLENFTKSMPNMQLVKILLAKSPVLVRMLLICPFRHDPLDTRLIAKLSKWRASSKAEVVYISRSLAKYFGS